MGSGIAEVAARAGFDVLVSEVDEGALEGGRSRIVKSMGRAVEKEKLSPAARDEARGRMSFTTSLADMADRDLVIE
ncbi:MAG: 3-hydroxybutyryl-CoA dehydrogenase, partial [Gammaproteobacteria bacterium]|nr:3-hydroxybutyryl-CoA dehydrogenase [Gammaproteobacteria bacterium]